MHDRAQTKEMNITHHALRKYFTTILALVNYIIVRVLPVLILKLFSPLHGYLLHIVY